ncbi:MAG: hypothetical protein IT370_00410 [Deltaproteobacteria bacterium]|nr:hypothetical protein [Deltaproteobacteria bacterium]
MGNVKGILFADYVRMIRGAKSVDWSRHLQPDDLPYLRMRIAPDEWYPMASFERLGNAILAEIARGDLQAVRMWGRLSVEPLRSTNPMLVAERDPVESLTRFRVLRGTFFDFEAISIPMLHDGEARIAIDYGMGMPAEEAACMQAVGFFERVLELSGCTSVSHRFLERSWVVDPRTLLELTWRLG